MLSQLCSVDHVMRRLLFCFLLVSISVGKGSNFICWIEYPSGTLRTLEGFCSKDCVGVDGGSVSSYGWCRCLLGGIVGWFIQLCWPSAPSELLPGLRYSVGQGGFHGGWWSVCVIVVGVWWCQLVALLSGGIAK